MNTQGVSFRNWTEEEAQVHLRKDWDEKEEYYAGLILPLWKEAYELETLLVSRGYGFAGTIDVDPTGYTISYHKKAVDGVKLHFDFWFDNQGGPDYTTGKLSSYHNPFPNHKFMAPLFFPETTNILKRYWKYFSDLEMNMRLAVTMQAVITEDKDDI